MTEENDCSELRSTRVLMLLDAAEHAGLSPIPVRELHALAFLANVLSPVWNMPPQKRTVVHKRGGPYYPELQDDVDTLVARGIVGIEELKHRRDADGRWRLEGRFFLAEMEATQTLVNALRQFTDEATLFMFYRELAFAFATIPGEIRGQVVQGDAVYDVDVGDEVIIDFAEWKQANYSENAARYFDQIMPDGQPASPAQKLHLYAHHLKHRLAASG